MKPIQQISGEVARQAIDKIIVDELANLNVVKFGFNKPLYWIEMPDGKRSHFITQGKFAASLAIIRMNSPSVKLEVVGVMPPSKKLRKRK